MISLKTLITMAPFADDMKQKLEEALPTMSEQQKFDVTDLCWTAIMTEYDMKLTEVNEDALLSAGLGKQALLDEEIEQKQNAILDALAKKIFERGETGALKDAREELNQIQEDLASQKSQAN